MTITISSSSVVGRKRQQVYLGPIERILLLTQLFRGVRENNRVLGKEITIISEEITVKV